MPDDASPSGGDTSSEVVDRDWLGHELERLDVEQRAVLVLDIPYGTAASRLHRGLEAMRASLAAGRATTERSVGRRPA